MCERRRPDPSRGVFETLLVLDGTPVELDAHMRRLERSVRRLYGAEPPGGVRARVARLASGHALARVRVDVAPRDGDERGELCAEELLAPVRPEEHFPAWERAVALEPLTLAGGAGEHKWADRRVFELPRAREKRSSTRDADVGGDRLALVLDGEEVLECSRANVFAVQDGALVTPPLDGRLLAGIARAGAIEAARAIGVAVHERPLTLERVLAAGEAFVTNSVRGVEPVGALGGARMRAPGEVARAVAGGLRERWMGVVAGV